MSPPPSLLQARASSKVPVGAAVSQGAPSGPGQLPSPGPSPAWHLHWTPPGPRLPRWIRTPDLSQAPPPQVCLTPVSPAMVLKGDVGGPRGVRWHSVNAGRQRGSGVDGAESGCV